MKNAPVFFLNDFYSTRRNNSDEPRSFLSLTKRQRMIETMNKIFIMALCRSIYLSKYVIYINEIIEPFPIELEVFLDEETKIEDKKKAAHF